MSDLDSMTDLEVAQDLEKLNVELSKKGILHAYEDAVMIQAVRRLREYGSPARLIKLPLVPDDKRCTSVSPQTGMRCELPANHLIYYHKNGVWVWHKPNDPADEEREVEVRP